MRGIRRRHGRPPDQKEAVLPEDLLAMLATLGHDLRDLRDRAILLISFAGGLRRSEITGLDCGPDHTEDGTGWIEILSEGAVVRTRSRSAGARSKSAGAPATPPAR
jgi:integrase